MRVPDQEARALAQDCIVERRSPSKAEQSWLLGRIRATERKLQRSLRDYVYNNISQEHPLEGIIITLNRVLESAVRIWGNPKPSTYRGKRAGLRARIAKR